MGGGSTGPHSSFTCRVTDSRLTWYDCISRQLGAANLRCCLCMSDRVCAHATVCAVRHAVALSLSVLCVCSACAQYTLQESQDYASPHATHLHASAGCELRRRAPISRDLGDISRHLLERVGELKRRRALSKVVDGRPRRDLEQSEIPARAVEVEDASFGHE